MSHGQVRLARIVVPLLLLSLALPLACAPGAGTTPGAEVETIKIGGLFPFTGALSEFGAEFERGARLAEQHLKDAGVPVELVVGDSETNPTAAVGAARKLVETDRVHALVGPAASSSTQAVAESVTINAGVPQVSPSATSPLLTSLQADQGKDFLFRTCPSDALQGVVLGRLARSEGYATASVLYVDNAYGQGLLENFERSFTAEGGQVLAKVPHPEAGLPSYVAELQRAVSGNPDVLVAISYPEHGEVYLKEAVEGNFIETFLFVDGTKSQKIIDAVGAGPLEGMLGTAPGSAESDSLARFNEAFQAAHGRTTNLPFISNTYDAVIVLGLAAYKAQLDGQGLSGAAIRDALRAVSNPPGETVIAGAEGIKRAVELLKEGRDINYEGAAGSVDFDENGDVVTPIEVWTYEGGTMKTVRLESP